MKKSRNIGLSVLLAVCAFCLCFALVGCKGGNKDTAAKYGCGEEGFYYYDGADSSRYMLSLQSGTYMITVNNMATYSGSYSYDEESGTVSFKGDTEFAATLGESALSLDMEGSGYSFKAFKYFDVSYVDGNGEVVYTDSVLNGQSPANISGEDLKDGYWFIDWYVDSSNSAVYSFDTSIAGETTIYGWFVEKSASAVEHTITLDYGDGYTESMSTMNGTIYRELPTAYGGLTVMGWWVSATNKSGELTYRYAAGEVFDADTTLFAVYEGLGSSVTSEGVTWDTSKTGANVTITVTDSTGKESFSDTVQSSSGSYKSDKFANLGTGVYTVTISSGSGEPETRVYVVNGLSRVSLSESDIIVNGSGRVLSFAPVEGADGYKITVTNGEKTVTEDLGSHTYYNFSDWEMTKEGITFVVTAYADGYADSVSDGFTYLLVLGDITLDISDDIVSWSRVDGALEYVVTITDVDGNVIDSFRTSDTSFSLKYYENGTYGITVQPHTDGYYSEAETYFGYAKDSLMAPKIINVTNTGISWEDVGADYYVVVINGVPYGEDGTITGTTLLFSESTLPESKDGTYEISVKAVKTDGSDSPYSDIVVATEEFSSAVSYGKNTIYWGYDIAATYYGVSVNGGEEIKADGGNSFKVTLTKAGDNVITVTAYDEAGVSLGSAEMKVYAYSVILDPNGATLVNDSADSAGTIYVAIGDELNLGSVEKDYADFVGWYTQADFTNGQSDVYEGVGSLVEEGSTFTGSGAMYLYAYWTYKYLDVTLDVGAGTLVDENGNPIASVKIKYNSTSFSIPAPSSSSVAEDFMGWYSSESGAGTRYTDESGTALGVAFGGNEVLHASYLTTRSYRRTRYGDEVAYSVSATAYASDLTEMTVPEKYIDSDGTEYNLVFYSGAFSTCTKLQILNIPDTVLYIAMADNGYRSGTGAFGYVGNLLEVNVYAAGDGPDSTKEPVYFSADGVLFHKISGTEDVELVYYPYGRKISSYEIPAAVSNEYECEWDGTPVTHNVTTVPAQVFRGRLISSITFPSTITSIAASAFYDNTELGSVIFEEGGTASLEIADRAFRNCTGITEMVLPSRYSDFNAGAFSDCTALVNIEIEDGGVYSSEGGVLLDAAGTTLVYLPAGRSGEIVISELTSGSITAIGKNSFASNIYITSVVISASVTEIRESAFEGCTGMNSVAFEGGDNSGNLTIRTRAFYGCSLLREICLPSNLTVMEADAFGGCTNLIYVYFDARQNAKSSDLDFAAGSFGSTNYIQTLELGENVPSIEVGDIFDGGRLAKIVVAERNTNYYSDEYGVLYNKDASTILYYPIGREGDYSVDSRTTSIGSNIFRNRVALTGITIGENVNTIGDNPFAGCTALKSITVDEGNTNYGSENGILYRKAYDGETESYVLCELIYCPLACEVTGVTLGESIVAISSYAFYGNTKITSVEVKADSFTLGEYAFYGCTALTTVSLPESMTTVPAHAFDGCTYLASINIPTSVTTIGEYAFNGCSALTGDLTNSTDGIVLPEGLVGIGSYAFYDDSKLAVTIPSTVEKIDDYAFYQCWYDSSAKVAIVIESEGEGKDVDLTIGDYAFYYAQYADSLEIPGRVVSIGSYAFGYFGYMRTTGASITFGENSKITEISDYAFRYSYYVKEIEIPESVTSIGSYAFADCGSLTKVDFGENPSLQTIGSQAFASAKLESVTIPAGVTSIGTSAFAGSKTGTGTNTKTTYNLTGGDLEEGQDALTFKEGSQLQSIGNYAFQYTGVVNVQIPASVTSIGQDAFAYADKLESISFQGEGETSGLTSLGYECFQNCSSLETVDLPNNLKILGSTSSSTGKIFVNCTSLTKVTIPATVTLIMGSAFSSCSALTVIEFAANENGKCALEEMATQAIYTCTALKSFVFPESSAGSIYLNGRVFDGCAFDTVTLSSSVTEIGGCFAGATVGKFIVEGTDWTYKTGEDGQVLYGDTAIAYICCSVTATEIEIPDGIETVGGFSGQTSIQKVTLPASVVTISDYAFYGCTALEEVEIADGSALSHGTIGEYAFYNCNKLKSINLPEGVETLSSYVFAYCDLSGTTLPESVTYIDSYAMEYVTGMTEVNLPNVEYIGQYAFRGSSSTATGFETVRIGDSCTTIDSYAFQYCTKLTSVTLPSRITLISSYTFQYCSSLEYMEIPDGVAKLDTHAFSYCTSLEEAVLPDSITSIENRVFQGDTKLAICGMPANLQTLGQYVFSETALTDVILPDALTTMDTYCFCKCGSLETVWFDDNLASIGNYAFNTCTSLRTVVLGRGLTSVGTNLFGGCTALTYAYTGDSLTALGNYMFNSCTALETVEFGDAGIKSIGTNVFNGCTKLKNIVLENGLDSIGDNAFKTCTSLESIFIPSSVTSIGKNVFNSCSSTLKIYIDNNKTYADQTYTNSTWYGTGTRYYRSDEEPAFNEAGNAYADNYWYYGSDGDICIWQYSPDVYTVTETCRIEFNTTTGQLLAIYNEETSVSFSDFVATEEGNTYNLTIEETSYTLTLDVAAKTATLEETPEMETEEPGVNVNEP